MWRAPFFGVALLAAVGGRVGVVGRGAEGADPSLAQATAAALRERGVPAVPLPGNPATARAQDDAARQGGADWVLVARIDDLRATRTPAARVVETARPATGIGLVSNPFDFGRHEIAPGSEVVQPEERLSGYVPLAPERVVLPIDGEALTARLSWSLRPAGSQAVVRSGSAERGAWHLEPEPVAERESSPALDALRREAGALAATGAAVATAPAPATKVAAHKRR